MAILASIATGNFTTNTTWGVVDATSYNGAQTTGNVFTTAYSATNRTTAFTPGAITVSHIGFKLANRTGTTGTLKLHIALSATHVEVAGTEVTINTADLPVAATADLNGGWHFLKLASPVTLLAATGYEVEGKTSSATQITPHSSGTASNFSIALITTTNQVPAAGDDLIIGGEYTGAGTSNSFTVTMDQTATTDYGSAPTAANSLITPGLAICNKGTLTWGTTAATNYNMKMSNSIIVYSGGTVNMGTTGTPCPRDSTMTLQFDCGTNVDYGLIVRNLGTCNAQGLSRTSGKNIYYCKLNTDEAIASTSLGVDTDTGWLDNDEIAVASTTRTITDSEVGTLNGNAGASTLTVDGFAGAGGGLAVAHSGTSPTQAEVILLTRNVKVIGASATLQAYIRIDATATVDFDWVEIKWMGSGTANKYGVNIATTTGICSFQYCSFRNFEVSNSTGPYYNGTSGSGVTISNNVFWKMNFGFISIASGTSGIVTISDNICIYSVSTSTSAAGIFLADLECIFTNNTIVSCASHGIQGSENSVSFNSFSGNTVHSSAPTSQCYGLHLNGNIIGGTVSNMTVWRCGGSGYGGVLLGSQNLGAKDVVYSNWVVFGNQSNNIVIATGYVLTDCIFDNALIAGDSTFSTSYGIYFGNSATTFVNVKIINSTIGNATGIYTTHTVDIEFSSNISVSMRLFLINTKLGSSTEINLNTLLSKNSFISSQKHDQTTGLHKLWKKYGIITIETTTVQAGSTSMKMAPNNASNKLESSGPNGGFKVIVGNGQTCTPTVYVYENGSYNGARARLIVKRNDAMGISADTVLDTATAASDAAWEALTGTTAAVTDDGVLEFVVDCSGTAGNLFVDTFSATVA